MTTRYFKYMIIAKSNNNYMFDFTGVSDTKEQAQKIASEKADEYFAEIIRQGRFEEGNWTFEEYSTYTEEEIPQYIVEMFNA